MNNPTAYPQNNLNRASNYITMFDTTNLPYNVRTKSLCYTTSKGTFIYKPHSAYGMVGTTTASRIARSKRL
jgi:hypothetical protein